MADSKKYDGNTWEHSLRKLTTATDTITTLPADLYADGNNATVGLVGNMSQTGTPTPDNPIMPQGTGERTANLFDMSTVENGKGIAMDGSITNYTRRCSTVTPIDVSAYSNVTLSFTASLSRTRVIYALFNDSTLVTRQTAVFSGTTIDVSSGNKLYICFYDIADHETIQKSDLSNVMLNTGSTAKPFEPNGYKIPISSANITTPIYLGEVKTTRKIKKLVLTGNEECYQYDYQGSKGAYVYNVLNTSYSRTNGVCSHYPVSRTATENSLWIGANNKSIYFISIMDVLGISTVAAFKTYLQQQYANGTPVTVWYVLAEPTTGIVNEPLRKIGDYADTVSDISIPTITGADSFDVQTTLKPSEVSLAYTGWHDASVGEWDGSEWQ